jgi:hypothetical protein
MPIEVAPNRIELNSLAGGYAPDPEEGSLPLDQSPDLSNVIVDPGSGAVELRKGFTRLSAGRISALTASHWIRHLNYYEVIDGGTRKRYLICVLTNGVNAAANNIRIYAYDLINNTFVRIDTAGRSWAKASTEHWFAIVEGTYYGGTLGEVIYSWHPTNGWNADPTTPSVKTWVDAVNGGVNPATEYARDFAFKKNTKVTYASKFYSTLRGIRYKTWEIDENYRRGERVSRKATIGGSQYWRSFECIKNHTADANNRPGDGAGSPTTYWKKVRLKNVKDEDGEVTQDWTYMPLPGKGVVGTYHGNRLWVRHDDADNFARLQYSAPAKPEKDSLISDLDFRPTDWAPVDDVEGDGGGWFTVPFNKGDAIRALWSYGSYLIICGRWQSFVLAGTNEQTWNLRPLGKAGAISPQSICEHDGLVYFLSPDGHIYVTDGTTTQQVPGFEKVREHVKDRVDKMVMGEDTYNWHPVLVSYGAFLVISLPDSAGSDETLVYHPATRSWWKWDIPILDMAVGEKGRAQRMWLSTAITGASGQTPTVFEFKDDPGNEIYTDDDWEAQSGSASTLDITYAWRSAWFQFGGGTRNERRLRRVWALVTGETGHVQTVNMYKNYEEGSTLTTAPRTLVGTAQAEFIEGQVGTNDLYSVGIKLSGAANAQTVIHGVGIDTEPRRTRFHRG